MNALYFILLLEIIDALHSMTFRCCLCGSNLPFPSSKPTTCGNRLCVHQLSRVGLGTSVLTEIKRDPIVADFIISLYFTSELTKFNQPAPPEDLRKFSRLLKNNLPSMNELIKYDDDAQIIEIIGENPFQLLRWILFSNQSNFVSLPESLKFPQWAKYTQLMALSASHEAEKEFQKRKLQYGTRFFWHGSFGDRWYPIQRQD